MKIFVPLLCVLSMTVAEPPVGDGYADARSDHHHDHHHDHGKDFRPPQAITSARFGDSIATQGYLPTSRSTDIISQKYGTPNSRSAYQNSKASSPRSGVSQEYGVPALRNSMSQDYGSSNSRSILQEYGLPDGRSVSQEYGAHVATDGLPGDYSSSSDLSAGSFQRSVPSPHYGAPDFRSTPSEEYGVPQQGFGISSGYTIPSARIPSQRYGTPELTAQLRSNSLSRQYGVPKSRSGSLSQSYGVPRSTLKSNFAKTSPSSRLSSTYGPSSSRSLSTQYGAPTARNSDSYSQDFMAPSSTYGAPGQRSLSDAYGAPNERSLSQEYGVPSGRSADLKTDAYASTFESARISAPSQMYGAPSARSMPSEQYGVPDQFNSLSSQGYSYSRNALDELQNQEPANYDFAYKVSDYQTGSDFGHTESRQENKAEGTYFVVLPDGTKQIVEYEADERGFKPRISVEPAEGGYDENAADLTRSGPY